MQNGFEYGPRAANLEPDDVTQHHAYPDVVDGHVAIGRAERAVCRISGARSEPPLVLIRRLGARG